MSVELHCAWCWDCEECGAENFERAVEGDAHEPAMAISSESEMVAILQAEESKAFSNGAEMLSPELIAAIALAPKSVTCKSCGFSHFTEIAKIEE